MAEMSTHIHQCILGTEPKKYAGLLRMSYTKYFNHKYGRKGRMGERGTFATSVRGLQHRIVLNNYILRNGLHHKVSPTPFGYEYCSAREYFSKELGFPVPKAVICKRDDIKRYLPRYSEFPDSFVMNENGVFLRRCFLEVAQVELLYTSPRNYLFQMNRLTDESWIKDQSKDNTGSPIGLADIEVGFTENDISQMLNNENGRNFSPDKMQDMDVCRLIDKNLLTGHSVYELSLSQRRNLAKVLYNDYNLPIAQIRRCMGGL